MGIIPRSEIEEILAEKGQAEVKCEFCKRDYVLQGKELEEAYASSENKDSEPEE